MNKEAYLIRDYSLRGVEAKKAKEMGLADAEWYQTPVARDKMRELLIRRNGPGIVNTLTWFAIIFGSGYLFVLWWGAWYAVFPYIIYSTLYASTSDSRWHESGHGTVFKSDWMNNVLYEISSFMVFRQSSVWRWSHARHHSDTIIPGLDPEIAVPKPPQLRKIILDFFGMNGLISEVKKIISHSIGRIDPEVATYVPHEEYKTIFLKARLYVAIYATVIILSIVLGSLLPLMLIGLPTLLGSWLMPIYTLTQHSGLEENVLDHRLNSRTVYMNRVNRFLYMNMNYHIEHHMFPLVPYHNLPKLHELIKDDCPKPYSGLFEAYKELIPALLKQRKDPLYKIDRKLPAPKNTSTVNNANGFIVSNSKVVDGSIEVCSVSDLPKNEVIRFDFRQNTYAIYRTLEDKLFATDGICTHGNAHLANGVIIGDMIECPKHNGRFGIKDGMPRRAPVCASIRTYHAFSQNGKIYLNLQPINNLPGIMEDRCWKVKSNNNVTTYIKELVLEPLTGDG